MCGYARNIVYIPSYVEIRSWALESRRVEIFGRSHHFGYWLLQQLVRSLQAVMSTLADHYAYSVGDRGPRFM